MLYIRVDEKYDLLPRVQAAMYFPNDINARELYVKWFTVNAEIHDVPEHERLDINAGDLKLLLDTPSRGEYKRTIENSIKKGIVAGDLLCSIYLMKRFNLETEPSINKAIHVLDEFGTETTYGDGTPIPHTEKSIRKAWNQFKPAAHLWAAFRLNQSYPYIDEHKELFSSEHNIIKMLSVAKELFNFGIEFTPKRARPKKPILTVADCFQISHEIKPLQLNIEHARTPDLLKKYLQSYSAPLDNI